MALTPLAAYGCALAPPPLPTAQLYAQRSPLVLACGGGSGECGGPVGWSVGGGLVGCQHRGVVPVSRPGGSTTGRGLHMPRRVHAPRAPPPPPPPPLCPLSRRPAPAPRRSSTRTRSCHGASRSRLVPSLSQLPPPPAAAYSGLFHATYRVRGTSGSDVGGRGQAGAARHRRPSAPVFLSTSGGVSDGWPTSGVPIRSR